VTPEPAQPDRPWRFHYGDGVEGLLAHPDVDHVFIDPPYSKAVDDGNAANRVRDNQFNFAPMNDELRNRTARVTAQKCRRWALIFCDEEEAHLWRFAIIAAGMSYYRTGHWLRLGTQPQMTGDGPAQGTEAIVIAHSRILTQRWNGGGKPAIWPHMICRDKPRHPTQKPAGLMRDLIADFTDEGETIADMFAGWATTGVAAVGLGRRFVGWELDKEHYQAGLARLELPLFERPRPSQTSIPDMPVKGARVRARMELERRVLNVVISAGEQGVRASMLPEIVDGTPKEVASALKRMQKSTQIVRIGRTSETRWYGASFAPGEKVEPTDASEAAPEQAQEQP